MARDIEKEVLKETNAEQLEEIRELEDQRDALMVQTEGQEKLLKYASTMVEHLSKQRAELREFLFHLGSYKSLVDADKTRLLQLLSETQPTKDPEEPA